MAKKGITYDEVVECAEALLEEGIKINADNVREELGFRGSYTTIYKHLKRWMDQKLKAKPILKGRERELNLILEEQAKKINELDKKLIEQSSDQDLLKQKNIELKNQIREISKNLIDEKKRADQHLFQFETLRDSLDLRVVELTAEKEKSIIRLERELKNVYERFSKDFDGLRNIYENRRVEVMVEIDSLKTDNSNLKKEVKSYSRKYEDLLLSSSRDKSRLKESENRLLEEKAEMIKEIAKLRSKLEVELETSNEEA